MPTVLGVLGLRVVIYPNDHRPAHVHVIGGGSESVWDLNCPLGPASLRENYGFSRPDMIRIRGQLSSVQQLCAEWERIHGES